MAGTSSCADLLHLVEAMDAGRGLFRDAAPVRDDIVPAVGVLGMDLLQQVLDDLLFVAVGGAVDPVGLPFSRS